MQDNIRVSGVEIIGDICWGTHFCQFYQTKEDLLYILVPYFKAGLKDNELCIWITSEPLNIEEAKKALKRSVPDFDVYLEKGQIELISYADWYLKDGIFNSGKAMDNWVEKLNNALAIGYEGLRTAENFCKLERENWSDFVNYEKRVGYITGRYPMITLCTYFLDKYNATDIIDIIANHQFALIKREGKWEQIESSGRRNITEIRSAEEACVSEEHYRSLYESSFDGILLTMPDGTILSANPQACYLFGMTEDEIRQAGREGLVVRDGKLAAALEERELAGRAKAELTFRRKNGSTFIGEISSNLFTDADGSIKTSMIIRDITERKKAETKLKETLDNLEKLVRERTVELEKAYNSLKESEKGLAEAQKMAHVGNWEWEIETEKSYWSDELDRIFGRNLQEPHPTYEEFLSYIHPSDREYVYNTAMKAIKGKPYSIDYRIIRADGEERTVHMQSEVIFDDKNTPVRIKGIVQDITERKEAEEALAKMENIRIKEIHHRIKNNLQVISSLLNLQAETFSHLEVCKVPEVVKAFMESQGRIISMALIHEELYKGDKIDTLDFAAYLRKLTTDLFNSYNLGNKEISFNLKLEQVYLGMDTAIPLGIIVNELVSNSFKHAFPTKREGEIYINLRRAEDFTPKSDISCQNMDHIGKKDFHYVLEVSDNGKGIPEEIDFENSSSLGLQLVNILVEQIDGCIKLERDQGTKFTIWFSDIEV